jgi:hypothetical protein
MKYTGYAVMGSSLSAAVRTDFSVGSTSLLLSDGNMQSSFLTYGKLALSSGGNGGSMGRSNSR